MFIQTEATPNPEVLKFIPGVPVLSPDSGRTSFECVTPEQAKTSPLASALMALEGVSAVFFGADFLTVRRDPKSPRIWAQLKAPILGAIMDHFTSGRPVIEAKAASVNAEAETGDLAQIIQEIKDLLDTRVRPAVAQDGGDIEFDRFDAETGTLYLHMRGACSGCPSSSATLKGGVESLMRHYVPEVLQVESAF